MKLRNKKTGKIGELGGVDRIVVCEYDMPLCGNSILGEYDTLAELNEDWEDYTPVEPLIKDEKIRKAVRAWAEVNGLDDVVYDSAWNAFRKYDFTICFDYFFDENDGLVEWKEYTIAELCGEEEE